MTKTVNVNQSIDDYGKNSAFSDWLRRINGSDKLPRGKFFHGKQPLGGKRIIMDESYLLTNR